MCFIIILVPVQETKHNDEQSTYISKNNGVMHCCGHDGHMAILLISAKILCDTRDKWSGCVKLLFQPAEEGLGGAKGMYSIQYRCFYLYSAYINIHQTNINNIM